MTYFNYFTNFIIGTCLGSHALVFIIRTERFENTIFSTSHCDSCYYPLTFTDQIPLISYLLKKGKCTFCHDYIPIIFFYSELVFGFSTININFFSCNGLSTALLLYFLFLIALSDFYYQEFDISLLFIPSIIIFISPYGNFHYFNLSDWLILIIFLIILSIMTIKKKFGMGDILIVFLISMFWGVITCSHILLFSSILCLLFSLFSSQKKYPFVPFIFIGLICYINFYK